jgi:rare lipoprotein A
MLRRSHADLGLCLMLGLSVIALSARMTHQPAPASVETIVIVSEEPAAPVPEVQAAVEEAQPAPVEAVKPIRFQTGVASWYGFHWQGRKTASGTRFDTRLLTAAHRSLPLNTMVRVTNLLNGRSVEVLVNDRGPYVGHRVIDLSEAAAKQLDMVKKGLAPVRIELLRPAQQVAMVTKPYSAATPARG